LRSTPLLVAGLVVLTVKGAMVVGAVFAVLWLIHLPLRPWIKPLR